MATIQKTKPAQRAAGTTAKAPKAATTKSTAKNSAPKSMRTEDVALLAYYLSEQRQQSNQPGSPEEDWLQAEQMLRSEIAG